MKIGRIYKVISTQSNDCYIGSTFDEIRNRFTSHKEKYASWRNGKYRHNLLQPVQP